MEYWDDYEVLRIETPEQLELRLPLAGFGPRFLAAALDYLILGVGSGVLIFIEIMIIAGIAAASGASSGGAGPSETYIESIMLLMAVLVILTALLPQVFYFAVFEAIWQGQTPGKRATGLRVIRRGGGRLLFRDNIIRNLLRVVDLLPSMGFVAWVSFFATRYQQRLGDLAADTVVVREFTSRQPFVWAAADNAPQGQSSQPGRLTGTLVQAIGSYLGRMRELSPETRERLSRSLINQLGYGTEGLGLTDRENYLATIMAQAMGVQGQPAPAQTGRGQQTPVSSRSLGEPLDRSGGPLGGGHIGI